MNWNRLLLVCALGTAISWPGSSVAAPPAPDAGRDLAAEVRAVFQARCASCHGPQLRKPRGNFGYVLDLQRLANHRELVVPFEPDQSELWALVRNNEMPPPDSPALAVSAREKEVIRAWIAAGAPAGGDPSAPDTSVSRAWPEEGDASTSLAASPARRALHWLGRFHLLLVHFPIGLLIAAAVGECWSTLRRAPAPSQAVRFCLWLGAVAALPTVGLGWLHAQAGHGAGSPGLLALHRWLGTTAGLWAVAVAVLGERDVRRGVRSWYVRVLLFFGALLVALTGHFGGSLVHGAGFFDW